MCFAPANVAAYLYTPPLLRGAAVGLLSLLRNEGGSVNATILIMLVAQIPGNGKLVHNPPNWGVATPE